MSVQAARMLVSPARALVDERVDITVESLSPQQPVTLQARLVEESARFQSYAHYRADGAGRVVLGKQPALGGTYTGVDQMGLLWSLQPSPGQKRGLQGFEPRTFRFCVNNPVPTERTTLTFDCIEQMGLFWSLQPSPGQKPGLRLRKKDVSTPFLVDLSLHDGHVDVTGEEENLPDCLGATTVERWYLGEGVERAPVREGRVRGTLFLPPGEGPFAGVIDLFGSTGGLAEYRAALLASRGFAVLALAFFAFDDLPKEMYDIDLDYFEEAADWLLSVPNVQSHGVGILSTSKGGEIALSMASHMGNKVAAAVAIGSYTAITGAPLPYKDKVFPCAQWIPENVVFTKEGHVDVRGVVDTTREPGIQACVQVEKAECPILFVAGEDDLSSKAVFFANQNVLVSGATSPGQLVLLLCEQVGPTHVLKYSDAAGLSKRLRQLIPQPQITLKFFHFPLEAIARMKAHGKTNYTLLRYPGTGHLIEPPYTPHCGLYYHGVFRWCMLAGGEPKSHAAAQENSWHQILRFFRTHVDRRRQQSQLSKRYKARRGRHCINLLSILKGDLKRRGLGPPTTEKKLKELRELSRQKTRLQDISTRL
ncbi:myristoyl-CoA hydrolase [Branchiostoma belcheri]|nr:myristoyl-CoA hydrolase [Branchiostoma belcheri]